MAIPATGASIGTPASINAKLVPQTLAIELEPNGEQVICRIIDSGGGIVREDLERVFEPFYSTKGREGTGLGLAVVWGIVERHGGRVDLSSEVGKGTTVKIRLPTGSEPTLTQREVA